MSVTATTTNTGVSARKVRLVLNLVRGMEVEDALTTLQFMPTPIARSVAKLVRSAVANAENELMARTSALKIVDVFADEAPPLKRFRARARGRGTRILRPSSHITVIVDEEAMEVGE